MPKTTLAALAVDDFDEGSLYVQGTHALRPPSRRWRRGLLFHEDFAGPQPGMFNDAKGAVYRDCTVPYDGRPSLRLDPQGNFYSQTGSTTVKSASVTAGGSGYSAASPPSVTFSGGGATTQATALALVNAAGAVYGLRLLTAGSGYSSTPAITIAPPGAGVQATAVAHLYDPGNPVNTSGVVLKRRLVTGNILQPPQVAGPAPGSPLQWGSGAYAWEGKLRWSSQNNTVNQFTTVSLYTRDGTNGYAFRVWLDPVSGSSTQLLLKVLNAGLWEQFDIYPLGVSQHLYDLKNDIGHPDIAGGWCYWRLVGDFATGQYRSFQLNERVYDLSYATWGISASTGAMMHHFSVEYTPGSSTARYINLAECAGEQVA